MRAKPTPTRQRLLAGNPGKRKINRAEPQPPPTDFDHVPRALEGNAEATAEWIRLAPMLKVIRQITEGDRAALIALCLEWSRYLEAGRKAQPRVVKMPSGYRRPNPWLLVQQAALSSCLKLWPELGLTPSSRSRVVMTPTTVPIGGDTFSEFDRPVAVA